MRCFTTPYSATVHLLFIFRISTTIAQSLFYENMDENIPFITITSSLTTFSCLPYAVLG